MKIRRGRPITTTAAGYGSEHQKLRRKWAMVVDRGEAHCWRCGKWLVPGLPWHLGHDDYDRRVYRGPECVPCNVTAPARRRARKRRRTGSRVW